MSNSNHDSSESPKNCAGVWPLVGAELMRTLDRRTIEDAGVAGEVLMESAGRALVSPVLELRTVSTRPTAPIRILCGAGNNGGDGFVLLRHLELLAAGAGDNPIAAEVILVGDPGRLPSDARLNWERLGRVNAMHRAVPLDALDDWLATGELRESSVLVDALFGTGLRRPIEGPLARLIGAVAAARDSGARVCAVDLPSGIDADTGQIVGGDESGAAVRADRTVTISLPKIGLVFEPGRERAGDVVVARVGILDPKPTDGDRTELWNRRALAGLLPVRPTSGHKGTFGHVLVAGGSAGMVGATALCARGAARAGAGLVTVAYPVALAEEAASIPVEVMTQGLSSALDGGLSLDASKGILELARSRDAVAFGPGLGRASHLPALAAEVVRSVDVPLVIDADGLQAMVGQIEILQERQAATILTPHPGEAAALLSSSVVSSSAAEVNGDRIAAARMLAKRSGAIVVLKGAGTIVAEPAGSVRVISTGGPVLATGGTGDVLTGVLGALLAGGVDPFDAATLAAGWHGGAADQLAASGVGFGWLASEVADALPAAAAALASDAAMNDRNDGNGGKGEALALRFPGS